MDAQKDNIRNNEESTNLNQVGEPLVAYHQSTSPIKGSQIMTQEEIDAECLSLEESKRRILDKVHHYYQR